MDTDGTPGARQVGEGEAVTVRGGRIFQHVSRAFMIPVDLLERDPHQPRQDFRTRYTWSPSDEAYSDLTPAGNPSPAQTAQSITFRRHEEGYLSEDELTQSIHDHGVLQLLLVRPHPEKADHFIIIAGNRRWICAMRAGLSEVPCIVQDGDAVQIRTIQLVENIQRKDLTPIDEGRAYSELLQYLDNNVAELARRVGKTPQHVNGRLRVIRYVDLAEAVNVGQIAYTVAREIIALPPAEADILRRRVRAGYRVTHSDIAKVRPRHVTPAPHEAQDADEAPAPRDAIEPPPTSRGTRADGHGNPYSVLGRDSLTPLPEMLVPAGVPRPDGAVHVPRSNSGMPLERPAVHSAAAQPLRQATESEMQLTSLDGVMSQTSATRLNRADGADDADTTLKELLAAFSGSMLPHVEELLLYGFSRGWTIGGLLNNIKRMAGPW